MLAITKLVTGDYKTAAIIVIACAVVSMAALRRRWSPSMATSVAIGLGLRIVIAYLAYHHTPHDVAVSFQQAGQSVLDHKDPLSTLPQHQWNFLPFSAYLFALEIKTGLPWHAASKLLPIVCDVATIGLVGCFAEASARDNLRLVYALSPLAVLVSAWHGQIEPIAITLGLSALLLARRRREVLAGVVLGLAAASKTWPILFAAGVLRTSNWTRWWRVAAPAIAVPVLLLFSIPWLLHDGVRHALKVIFGYRSFLGTWGWTGLLRHAHVTGVGYAGPHVDSFQRVGTALTAITLLAILLIFRRCSGPDITIALMLGFLTVSAGFGIQYLLWPAALVCATGRRSGQFYLLLAGFYAAFFYLYIEPADVRLLSWPATVLEFGSVPVIVAAVASMPWSARQATRTTIQETGRQLACEVKDK